MSLLLTCRNLTKHYGTHGVLQGVDWNLQQGAVTGLLGESGAGKTTLVRIMAGLERPTTGVIEHTSQRAGQCPLRVSMVFQNLALWPHLTARKHVEYVMPQMARQAKREFVESLLEEVHLPASVWNSKPEQLSGGEAQRLALARAIASEPELLLLDEPLAQVDMPLREALIELVRSLAETRSITTVCVSHSWADVMQVADRLAVLHEGRIAQQGSHSEVYNQPLNAQLARLTGPVVALPGELIRAGRISVEQESLSTAATSTAEVLVRPQQIQLRAPSGVNHWQLQSARPYYLGWKCTFLAAPADDSPDERVTLCISSAWRPCEAVGIHVVGQSLG